MEPDLAGIYARYLEDKILQELDELLKAASAARRMILRKEDHLQLDAEVGMARCLAKHALEKIKRAAKPPKEVKDEANSEEPPKGG